MVGPNRPGPPLPCARPPPGGQQDQYQFAPPPPDCGTAVAGCGRLVCQRSAPASECAYPNRPRPAPLRTAARARPASHGCHVARPLASFILSPSLFAYPQLRLHPGAQSQPAKKPEATAHRDIRQAHPDARDIGRAGWPPRNCLRPPLFSSGPGRPCSEYRMRRPHGPSSLHIAATVSPRPGAAVARQQKRRQPAGRRWRPSEYLHSPKPVEGRGGID